jgi:hypothetical protein
MDEDGQQRLRARHKVFGGSAVTPTRRLVEGPRPDGEALSDVYILEDPDPYYASFSTWWHAAPELLTPSQAKLHYGAPLREFWRGMTRDTALWGGLAIIGYSLPPSDPYTRQVLYELSAGHSYALNHSDSCPWPQSRMKVIDYRIDEIEKRQFFDTYRFLNNDNTDFELGGLSSSSLEVIFASL